MKINKSTELIIYNQYFLFYMTLAYMFVLGAFLFWVISDDWVLPMLMFMIPIYFVLTANKFRRLMQQI